MTEEPLYLRRDLTNDELVRYLESEPMLAELASVLAPGVDSNLIFSLHAACKKPDSGVLEQCFLLSGAHEMIAPRIVLATRLHSCLLSEKETARLTKKTKKTDRSANQAANLEAAMRAEKESRVTAEHSNLLFQANVASSEHWSATKDKRVRERYEATGTTFNVTLPQGLQDHHSFLLNHLGEVLADLSPQPPLVGGKLKGEIVREMKKGKGKGAVAEVRAVGGARCVRVPSASAPCVSQSKYKFKIFVPGHVLVAWFLERERKGKDLLLNTSQGPFAMAQLMAHVSVVMKESRKKETKYINDTTSSVMREHKVESITPPSPPATPRLDNLPLPRRRAHSRAPWPPRACAGHGARSGHCALCP